MQGKGLLVGMAVTLKHFFRKKETIQYPEETLPMSKAYRGGRIAFNKNKCIACKLCALSCPNNALELTVKVDENKKRHMEKYVHKSGHCLYCNFCIEACPTKAISWDKDYTLVYYHRKDLTYDAMLAPERRKDDE